MHTIRLFFTVIMALLLMGCPPPVSDNPHTPASEINAPTQSGHNPEPKAIVLPRVSAGRNHTMILKADDTLWAFGDNEYGQLGNGNSGDNVVELNPVQVMTAEGEPMTEVGQVVAGAYQTMILKKNGDLWAVGNNDSGQLGDGNSGRDVVAVNPVQVMTAAGEPMTGVDQVSAGTQHSMILKENGTLWAVGANLFYQLGDGTRTQRSTPVAVKETPPGGGDVAPAITEVDQISCGSYHSMILKENGALWAVGGNEYGQLGDGTKTNKSTSVEVKEKSSGSGPAPAMTAVAYVSSGSDHAVILRENGDVWAVGRNDSGQLGDGTNAEKKIPVQVKTAEGEPMTEVTQVSAGRQHSMILKENGTLWAVGRNDSGQLGDGSTAHKKIPVQVMIAEDQPMTEVARVSAGGSHTIIVKRDGSLWAVGSNDHGQLGTGDSDPDAKMLFPVEITVD